MINDQCQEVHQVQEKINRTISLFLIALVFVLFIPSVSFGATYDDADTITYTTKEEKEVDFDEDDFFDACDDVTSEDLDYVKFTLPDSDYGTLYYDYDEDDDSNKVKSKTKYYYDRSPYLSRVTFVPEEDYNGTVTIRYTGYDVDENTYDGKVKITVKEGDDDEDADDITYTIDGDSKVTFDKKDFDEVCEDLMDENLDYVKFTKPSSSTGILYYDYESDKDYHSKITESTKYYYNESPYLSKVSFVPKKSYEGTVTIKYTGYDEEGDSFKGKVKVKVEEIASGELEYTIDEDETLTFDEEDFDDISRDKNDEDLDYITFTLPSDSKGVLYYDYDDGDYDAKVSASKKYYYDRSPYLSKVTFVPDKKFSGICSISYKGYDEEGDSFTGTVDITVQGDLKNADTITYSTAAGSPVYFKEENFNSVCKKLQNYNLDYVRFTLPSSSAGKLYYGYNSAKNYTSEVSASTRYYNGSTPFLLNVAYVPSAGATGTTTISYTGYDVQGSAFSGKVQVNIGGAATNPVTGLIKSKYFQDVDEAYSWAVDYVDSLYTAGIVSGTGSSGGTKLFNPATKITRGEYMVLIFRALNLQTNTSAGNFADVVKGSYYYDAIATAKALGIAQGSENKFLPNSTISRQDAMVLAYRALSSSGKAVTPADTSLLTAYSDNYVIDSYAKESIAALIKAGIITGSDDNKIHPMESITRVQAAAIVFRVKN